MVHVPFFNFDIPEPRLADLLPRAASLALRGATRVADAARDALFPLSPAEKEAHDLALVRALPREMRRAHKRILLHGNERDALAVSSELEDASYAYYRRRMRTAVVGRSDEETDDAMWRRLVAPGDAVAEAARAARAAEAALARDAAGTELGSGWGGQSGGGEGAAAAEAAAAGGPWRRPGAELAEAAAAAAGTGGDEQQRRRRRRRQGGAESSSVSLAGGLGSGAAGLAVGAAAVEIARAVARVLRERGRARRERERRRRREEAAGRQEEDEAAQAAAAAAAAAQAQARRRRRGAAVPRAPRPTVGGI